MPDNAYEKASEIRRARDKKVEAVRGDATLSREGKRQRIAAAELEAQKKMAAVKDSEMTGRRTRLERLERQAFGRAGDTVAYRDAVARAEAAENPEQARRLLDRAKRIGDHELARATALVASERGWHEVIERYAEGLDGSGRKTLNELVEARGMQTDRTVRFADSMQFSLQRPAELATVSDHMLERVAAGENTEVGV